MQLLINLRNLVMNHLAVVMHNHLKILHLEDNDADAELVARVLVKSGLSHTIVHANTREEFILALEAFIPDVILSDHSLASFNSREAFQLAHEFNPAIPFLLVTGAAPGECGVALIKEGAADYIVKKDLQRLPAAINIALENSRLEKEDIQKALRQQESERNEIGRELHDNINQVLAAAKLYVQSAIDHKEKNDELLRKGQEYILMAISEIRKLSHTLVTPSLREIPLVTAVTELMHDVRQTTQLQINFTPNNYFPEKITEECKLMFYRIIQEQVMNIIKYANASAVSIDLHSMEHLIVLKITDDGKGFNKVAHTEGIGLKNIRNRAAFYNGRIKITTEPGKGCSLAVYIPLKHK